MSKRSTSLLTGASLHRPWVLSLLIMFLCHITPLAAQDPPPTVKLGEKEYTARKLQGLIDDLRNLKARKTLGAKAETTELEKQQLLAWDRYQGHLERLQSLLREIESGNRRKIADYGKQKKAFETAARTARDAFDKIKLPEPITQELITKLEATEKAKKQAESDALAELEKVSKAEIARQKDFEAVTRKLEELAAKRKELDESLSAKALGADEKLLLETRRNINECEIRLVEIQRDHHASFVALDKAAREWALSWRNAAQAESALAHRTLELARLEYQKVLEKKSREEKAKAERLRNAARDAKSRTRKAVLGLEALLNELRAQKNAEENTLTDVRRKLGLIESESRNIEELAREINELLPEDVELDPFKEGYLKQKIIYVRVSLLRFRTTRDEYHQELEAVRRDVSSTRFDLKALQKSVDPRSGPDFGEHTLSIGGAPTSNALLEKFHEIKHLWSKSRADVETFDISKAVDPDIRAEMQREKDLLPERTVKWDKTINDITSVIAERLTTLNNTFEAARECLEKIHTPVNKLEKIQQYLSSKAFWLKEEPPFGAKRRELMEEELGRLRENFPRIISQFGKDFFGRIHGLPGILGMLLLASSFLLFAYRRAKQKAIEGARAAFARTEDPLYRLFSMSAWLMLEIGHQILAIGGIMLLWRSTQASDPVAATIELIVALAAIRLALLRILLYAEVSDQETSKLLFIDARRLIKIALFGLYIVVPPIAFFERTDSLALSQASRTVATCWILFVALRMAFRRDIVLVLLPSKDIGALSRGLKHLIHYFWPLLTAFIAVIAYLKFVGYRTASEELAARSFLGGGVLLTALVAYQFIQAYIDSKTIAITSGKDGSEKGHSETKEDRRYRATVRRVFSLPLLLITIVATVLAMSWAVGITAAQWESWGSIEVIQAVVDKDGNELVPAFQLSNIGWALLTLAVGYVIGGTIRDIIVIGGTSRTSEDKRGTRYALGTLIFYILMTVTLIFSLRSMNVNLADYSWLLGTAGVALGFGMTEILSNFVCGIILFVERPVQVGDIITVGDVEGDVRKISIRSTIIQTRDGVSIILPNRRLIEADVINWSHSDPLTRLRINVGAAYGSDVALVKKALMEVAMREGRVLKRPVPEVAFIEFGESELSFQVLCWLPTPDITVHRRVRSDLNSAIDAAFRRYGIEIPFPQRDLHIRSTPETRAAEEAARQADEDAAAKPTSKSKDPRK